MQLADSMIENVVTMLGWSPQGNIINNMLEGVQLPDEYGLIADRCAEYWRKHKQPPGVHLIDLFADILGHKTDPRGPIIQHILSQMLAIKDQINTGFVLGRMRAFKRVNAMRQAVLDVAARLSQADISLSDEAVQEAEELLSNLLRAREVEFDPGLGLTDVNAFIDHISAGRGMTLGIAPLDKVGATPQRKTLHTVVGVTGHGKTWWLVHVGCCALRQRMKVVHISLEISAPAVLQRYYQTLFTASERDVKHLITDFIIGGDRITGTTQREVSPEFAFRHADGINPEINTELVTRLMKLGASGENLRIRAWSPRITSIGHIEAYLDTLADGQHFQPDVILVDYPQLMKARSDNFRLDLGQNVEHLRRLAIERNCAVCIVHQSSRVGAQAKVLRLTHVAEDWSVVQTSDTVITYSATDGERKLGLARMHIDKARAPGSIGRTMILTQNYDLGQYCIASVLMPDNYMDYMASARPSVVVDDDEPEVHDYEGVF